ncbi:hypothetical protein BKA65DRAFT_557166 [Rhexocercosporidium sp. MPI-PUGE-AT-0058]|nr:hypothetical protein BKA65DRAFT_557166 [Rhexocercosporidium sp. MPI-PUGE-AT-0058]
MVSTYIIVSAVIAFIAVALGAAYTTGALDPVIEQFGIMFFKAKAEAEKKKLQAQGMKEGQDFVGDQLKGNQQASDVASGLGGIGGLKKGL